ncbi:MAG: serine/threonine protein kinase [Myxococcota bacterium]
MIQNEPELPRRVVPELPPDLEAITLKCLEKDLARRYDSALALAQDLDRFLSGEPVHARPADRRYRVQKWLLKHRKLTLLMSSVGILVMSTLSWGYYVQQEMHERERLARAFTEQVERIEASARYAALSPLHPLVSDRASLEQQMSSLSDDVQRYGKTALGPGHYALGRGYMALGEPEEALQHLELAWQNGFQEPRAAYALALVLAQAYQTRLREAERRVPKARLQDWKDALAQQYRAPLLDYLAKSQGAPVPSEAYVQALVAFAEARFDDALQHLERMELQLPWFYEAPALRAEVFRTRAYQKYLAGDRVGATSDLAAGRAAYRTALEIGESVPALFLALSQLEHVEMTLGLYGDGQVQGPFERATQALSQALLLQPTFYEAWLMDATLRRRMGEQRMNQGESGENLLKQALESVQKAIGLDPTRAEGLVELASIYWQQAEGLNAQGKDPSLFLSLSVETLECVKALERDYEFHRQLGLIHQTWAEYLMQSGGNAEPQLQCAVEAFQAALAQNEEPPAAWINLGTLYYQWGTWPPSSQADHALSQAQQALKEARKRDPGNTVVYFYEAQTLQAQAQRAQRHGIAARPLLNEALELHLAGVHINARLPHLHNGAGAVLLALAQDAWEGGADPLPLLDAAEHHFRQALEIAPQQGYAYFNLSETRVRQLHFHLEMGERVEALVAEAITASSQSTVRMPELAPPWASLAQAHLLSAESLLQQGKSPLQALHEAEVALNRALKLNPGSVYALHGRAERLALLHRHKLHLGVADESGFEAATQAYQQVLALDVLQDEHLLRLGWHYWHDAAFSRAGEGSQSTAWEKRVEVGLETVQKLLQQRPHLPEGRLLRGALLLVQAEHKHTPEMASRLAQEALTELVTAWTAQPRLKRRWQGLALRAQVLADTGATLPGNRPMLP